jgi:hypothetical protein
MMFRIVFWDILPCKMIIGAIRTSEKSVDNNFTWQYIPEDNSEHLILVVRTVCLCSVSVL